MVLVLDVRALQQVIDRISRANFYVTTRVSYRHLDRSELLGPYVYGPAPVVEATLLFERYFFPTIYADKMPLIVHELLGHSLKDQEAGTRGPRPGTGTEGGRGRVGSGAEG